MLFAAAFGLAFLLDLVWAFYVSCVAAKKAGLAAFYSAAIVALGGLNVLLLVRDWRTLLAAGAGAFFGTYLGVGVFSKVWERIKP
jgi:uncharacterized membrane protein YfcA